jgi:hypothetical protein
LGTITFFILIYPSILRVLGVLILANVLHDIVGVNSSDEIASTCSSLDGSSSSSSSYSQSM